MIPPMWLLPGQNSAHSDRNVTVVMITNTLVSIRVQQQWKIKLWSKQDRHSQLTTKKSAIKITDNQKAKLKCCHKPCMINKAGNPFQCMLKHMHYLILPQQNMKTYTPSANLQITDI